MGREDLQKIYAKQQQELESYAWEDRKAGVVRIPIERAMDLLLEKGLPVMPSGAEGRSTAGNLEREEAGGAGECAQDCAPEAQAEVTNDADDRE